MKNCETEGCNNQIDDKYKVCFEHYAPGPKKTDFKSTTVSKWHNDDVVDQLMKINSNLGKINANQEQLMKYLAFLLEDQMSKADFTKVAKTEDLL